MVTGMWYRRAVQRWRVLRRVGRAGSLSVPLVALVAFAVSCGSDEQVSAGSDGTDQPSTTYSECPGDAVNSLPFTLDANSAGYPTRTEAVEHFLGLSVTRESFAEFIRPSLTSDGAAAASTGSTGAPSTMGPPAGGTGVTWTNDGLSLYIDGRLAGGVHLELMPAGGYLVGDAWFCTYDFPLRDAPAGGTTPSAGDEESPE
jgi:hypothetical protein